VDEVRIAQAPAPITPTEQEEAHEELLTAAGAALAWFESFDEQAPSDLRFGGEARIRTRLRRAIRRQR
jgi:hypothetical protein